MKRLDLSGKRFGNLQALEFAYTNQSNNAIWKCVCDCGNECYVNSQNLKNGTTKSCGCLKSKSTIERNKERQIGEVKRQKNRIYRIYYGMLSRCYNSKDTVHYKNYGARGISVCNEWKNSFEAFEKWALSNGYSDNLSIDRINNDGNYEPSNCRWVNSKEQSNNRNTNHLITYNGETKTVTQWAEKFGISKNIIFGRLHKGWNECDAITIPVGEYPNNILSNNI